MNNMILNDQFSHLSGDQKNLLPTEEDILIYEKNGWYASPVILDHALIDQAIRGAKDFYKGKTDFNFIGSEKIANDGGENVNPVMNNEFVSLQKAELQALGFHPMISAVAALLSRSSEIRLFADSLINKTPVNESIKQGAVGWHTDKAYWPTCTSDKLLTAWIPFQDCTIEMGTLMHIDQSHLWKDESLLKSFYSFNNQDLSKLNDFLKEHKPNHKKTPLLLKKGQVSFHNCHTIHASEPNTSKVNRMALAMHLQDETNQYQKAFNKDGELIQIGYDMLCEKDEDGNPDYSDEKIFPLLYTKL